MTFHSTTLVLFLQLLHCCTPPFMHSVIRMFFLLLFFSLSLLASCYVPLPTSSLHCYIPLSLSYSFSVFLSLVRSSVCRCTHCCLCRQSREGGREREGWGRRGEGESHCLAAGTESSWRVTTLNDHPYSHTHSHAGTLNKSYTLAPLMAGAIGHMPTM